MGKTYLLSPQCEMKNFRRAERFWPFQLRIRRGRTRLTATNQSFGHENKTLFDGDRNDVCRASNAFRGRQ
jgi:hypothetical protein